MDVGEWQMTNWILGELPFQSMVLILPSLCLIDFILIYVLIVM